MLDGLRLRCESCETPLADRHKQLTVRMSGGTRHAYECDCGKVTITVVREPSA